MPCKALRQRLATRLGQMPLRTHGGQNCRSTVPCAAIMIKSRSVRQSCAPIRVLSRSASPPGARHGQVLDSTAAAVPAAEHVALPHAHTHTNTHKHTHMHTDTDTHRHRHTQTQTHTDTDTDTQDTPQNIIILVFDSLEHTKRT